MSQQGGSSIVSSTIPNSEVKYQKALKQISKLINTNKILKSECEERQQILSAQISEIAMRCEELQKKYEESEHEKHRMQQFMQELQDTNQDLRKQYQTLQREVGYLNDVLSQQNAELKKLSMFKDEKGISQLFRSYQENEENYKTEIARLQQQVVHLKGTIDRVQDELMHETELRQRYEDQYNIIGLEINKYRQLNNYLMDKNEHVLNEEKARLDRAGLGNNQEVESVILELKRQLETLRNLQYQNEDKNQKQYVKNYELLLEEKNTLALELARLKDRLNVSEHKIKEMYELQEKMSTTLARSELIVEENNMLKNRITILESKEIIESAGFDEDSDLKVFEDKINFMISKKDQPRTIKNSDDNTHFVTMKSFIADLQLKLHSVIEQKQTIQKKYRNIKLKFNKKAEENILLEESNKLLKGKLEGFERLAEKLNYQLERSMQAHENEIVKMIAITNNLVGKKVEQSKTASAFIKSQFQLEIEKAERAQKTLLQQLQTLKLQNSTLRIKLADIQQKYNQLGQLSQILQSKLGDLSKAQKQIEHQKNQMGQKAMKFEQLYQEEKARLEILLVQKQTIQNKLNVLTEEFSEKSYSWEEVIRQKQAQYEGEIKRSRFDLQRFKEEAETLKDQNRRLCQQLDHYRIKETKKVSSIKEQNTYIKQLQNKYQQSRQQNHQLESELISLKNRLVSLDELKKTKENLETEAIKKSDEINDLKRAAIQMKKQYDNMQLNINELQEHKARLANELAQLKAKLYESPITSSNTSRQLQSRKLIQQLNQQIAILQSSIREQKRTTSRHLQQIQNRNQEIDRLSQIIHKNKQKQQALLESIGEARNQLLKVQDQLFEYKSRYSQSTASANNLGVEIEKATSKIMEVTEEANLTKSKLSKTETAYYHLMRDLNGTKHYIDEAERMIKRLNNIDRLQWEQQRQKDNISSLVDLLKKILKNAQNLQLSNTSSNQEYSFVPASSFGNFESNLYTEAIEERFNYDQMDKNQGQIQGNIVTNDTLRVHGRASNSDSVPNVNFSSEMFMAPSRPGFSFGNLEQA